LYLDDNRISDLTALSSLANLEFLSVVRNTVTDLSPLSGLVALERLHLDENQITDVSPLSGLTSLTYLSAWENAINDISALSTLKSLENLTVADNAISDLSGLTSLQHLRSLSLADNPLDREAYLYELPIIRQNNPQIGLYCDPCPWASEPQPADGTTLIARTPVLRWTSGAGAAAHEVYFGQDQQTVAAATKADGDIYRGRQIRDVTTYEPGVLEPGGTYYWRIDEVNDVEPARLWTGAVWSFTISDPNR
jgi:hypothetical protein